MANITVSFDSSCNLQCPDISPTKGTGIQWSADSSVSSFSISNVNPADAFSSAPAQGNGNVWNASLNPSFVGSATYQILAFPANTRTCGTLAKQKTPKISAVAPMPAQK